MNSAPDMEKFRSILKNKGLKATPQRLAVHEAMLELGHASADMVCEHVLKSGVTTITIASVYNILAQLAGLGLYRRIPSPDNKIWYDVTLKSHLHIFDRKRGEFKDHSDEKLYSLIHSYLKENPPKGYRVEDFDIHLVCHRSRNTKKV